MIHRRRGAMRFEKLLWITKAPPRRVGLYLINTTLPKKSGVDACISSRITTDIQVVRDYQRNYNWYNEPFAVFKVKELYLDMHGLIFETSVWLLAESTRLLLRTRWLGHHVRVNKGMTRHTFALPVRGATCSRTCHVSSFYNGLLAIFVILWHFFCPFRSYPQELEGREKTAMSVHASTSVSRPPIQSVLKPSWASLTQGVISPRSFPAVHWGTDKHSLTANQTTHIATSCPRADVSFCGNNPW